MPSRNARNVVSAVQSCYAETQDYTVCDADAGLDANGAKPGVPIGAGEGEVAITATVADAFAVAALSQSGTTFTITVSDDGTSVRTCDCSGRGRLQVDRRCGREPVVIHIPVVVLRAGLRARPFFMRPDSSGHSQPQRRFRRSEKRAMEHAPHSRAPALREGHEPDGAARRHGSHERRATGAARAARLGDPDGPARGGARELHPRGPGGPPRDDPGAPAGQQGVDPRQDPDLREHRRRQACPLRLRRRAPGGRDAAPVPALGGRDRRPSCRSTIPGRSSSSGGSRATSSPTRRA